MSAKQSGRHGKIDIKRLSVYSLLCAVCIVFGYIESLFPLAFIAPGIKLGLSNSVALILAVRKDYKGAFLVNTARILLCALLFGSATSLIFSLMGGTVSLLIIVLLSRFSFFGTVGLSVAGAIAHNTAQCLVAMVIVGANTLYYMPVLILFGVVSGSVIGIISSLILKKIKTNGKK